MASQEDPSGAVAPYPQPPSYLWSQFTEENEAAIQELRETHAAATGEKTTAATIVPDVPEALAALQPPEPPPNGRWRVFGQMYTLNNQLPSLEEQGVARLGAAIPTASAEKDAHASKVFELKKLAKSLLLNFLELAGILAIHPADAADKLADLQTIFFNMHQHINEWRPHQTREALISMLQAQLERTRNETRALHEVTDSVRKTLVGLADVEDPLAKNGAEARPRSQQAKTDSLLAPAARTAAEAERRRQEDAWAALDETFG
ncbi:mediator of RNA polymerase II transcription subunit 7 [Sporothrix brasiliensis 5110]|uniref:Mediator of RNA polymerase II transcription subunit 7 n=1 Tax=Sporothrix brasiliensis 5110 TaxID=1398154 RepID=A0A0C2IUU0_9PEZI|nr:mediator of RNA polymerase II transcription subunit 7 [Sporothrix brasiliensis 5110]KIH88752.1 mediator of RNA polymerase II transcription subunit 7 [Sporothrix brasiliensis 5110]